jgi:predicted nucleotidyltransferase
MNDLAAISFSKKIKNRFPNILESIWLFGSRARGDFSEHSDYDFLIVFKEKNRELIKSVRELEVDFLDEYDILAASLIYDTFEWEKRKKFSIGRNILREGILL